MKSIITTTLVIINLVLASNLKSEYIISYDTKIISGVCKVKINVIAIGETAPYHVVLYHDNGTSTQSSEYDNFEIIFDNFDANSQFTVEIFDKFFCSYRENLNDVDCDCFGNGNLKAAYVNIPTCEIGNASINVSKNLNKDEIVTVIWDEEYYENSSFGSLFGLPEGTYCGNFSKENPNSFEESCDEYICFDIACICRSFGTEAVIENTFGPDIPSGLIQLNLERGKEPLIFTWYNENNAIIGNASTLENLLPGEYTVEIEDSSCGFESHTFQIIDACTEIDLNSVVNHNCHPVRKGEILLNVENGTPPYNYNWSNGETESELYQIQEGEYSVTVTDANNCSSQETFEIQNIVSDMTVEYSVLDNFEFITPGGYEQLAIVEFIVSGSNPPFLVKFGGEEGIVESSGGSIIIETECRESYISGQQNHLLNVFDNFDCAYIDRNIEINCCRIGSNIEAVSYAVGEEENLACSSSLGILRFYNFNGIFPIKLTTQLISDFITPSIDFYQESIINQQYTNQQGEYFELQVPFAGIYRVEYEDECGNISIDYINTCQACDYDIIDDNYYLFGGGLVFDPQCFCDDDCGIGRGAEINISIDENFLYGDNLPVVIEWPMGSNTIIDENGIGGQHPYDLSDHYDNEEEYPESISITISRPDGCVIPLEFEYQNRTEVPYLRSSSNLHYDLFDCSYFASMICNDCFTIEGNNYITDYNDCEGVTAQINFEFIPNPNADQNNPCNDGGSFLIHSYNENGDFIKSQELNIGENLAIAHQSDPRAADIIFTDGNKKCNNGGVCYFDAMDILGIQLDCPLFLPYCFENEDRTDSTDDDDDDPDEGDNDSDCFEDFDYFNANRDPIGDITRVIGDVTEGTKVRTSFDIGAGLLITLELDGIVIWEKGCGKDSNSNITIENDGNLIFYSRHLCQGHGSKLIGEIWCEEGLKEKVATLFKLHQTTMILNLFLLQNCFYKITYQQ